MTNIVKGNITEKTIHAPNGLAVLFLNIAAIILSFVGVISASIALDTEPGTSAPVWAAPVMAISVIWMFFGWILFLGVKVVHPNEALVLTLFGKYMGTLKEPGIFFVNPFSKAVNPIRDLAMVNRANSSAASLLGVQQENANRSGTSSESSYKSAVSLKATTLNNQKQKINDEMGNPIEVGIVVIWKIRDTAKAVFNVDNYVDFVSTQADSALRDVVRLYPYDVSENPENKKSLRESSQEAADDIKEELQKRVDIAGIEIIESRITHLAYAPEIAAAMLQRQQANAIIDARQKIVDGAVGMVDMALRKLNENNICELDEERKAQMVSNLLVVLCGSKEAQPIVNSGSIY